MNPRGLWNAGIGCLYTVVSWGIHPMFGPKASDRSTARIYHVKATMQYVQRANEICRDFSKQDELKRRREAEVEQQARVGLFPVSR